MNITLGDGRQFVNGSRKQYDAIILDAFLGESSPSHLMTREAFAAMRRILRPNGVLVINLFGDVSPERDFLMASVQKTLTNVFTNVRSYSDGQPGEDSNVFFVASPTELRSWRAPTFDHVHPICRRRVEVVFSRLVEADPARGIVLTDDFNPVEYFDAGNREQLRRNLARYVRGL